MNVEQDGVFWALAGGMVAAIALFLWAAARRAGTGAPDDSDMRIYRDQLAEVDRDAARGVIDFADAERMRTEVSRRLLSANRNDVAARPVTAMATGVVPVAAAIIGGAAIALYVWIGAPGYPDMPMADRIAAAADLRANRPGQAEAEAQQPAAQAMPVDTELTALLNRLRAAVKDRPDLLEGHVYLAEYELRAGNIGQAAQAQAQVVRLKGKAATAADQVTLADLMIRAAGGYVSPEAEAALTAAVTLDPANGPARYYSGLMLAQTGRPDLAFNLWRRLLDDSAPGDPWVAPIRARIEDLGVLAGETYVLPPAPPSGPSDDDIAAAADMPEADRQAMIAGMVDQLADRLATDGGPATDWARLITALAVQGQTDRARAIWTEAQTVFAASPPDLAVLRQAAVGAKVAE